VQNLQARCTGAGLPTANVAVESEALQPALEWGQVLVHMQARPAGLKADARVLMQTASPRAEQTTSADAPLHEKACMVCR